MAYAADFQENHTENPWLNQSKMINVEKWWKLILFSNLNGLLLSRNSFNFYDFGYAKAI